MYKDQFLLKALNILTCKASRKRARETCVCVCIGERSRWLRWEIDDPPFNLSASRETTLKARLPSFGLYTVT